MRSETQGNIRAGMRNIPAQIKDLVTAMNDNAFEREDTSPLVPSMTRGKGLVRTFSSLRQRNFRLFWFGQLISLIGSGMQSIGQVWLVLALTHSAWQIGVVGALQALPLLCFSLFGGVFADRWPKRRVLLLTQTASMLQALLLWILIATGTIQLWHLYILVILLGLTKCLNRPTSQAFIVEMVGRAELPNAVALNASLTNLSSIVGPGLGGVIIAISGVSMLFLLNALSFLAIIVGLVLINSDALYAQAQRIRSGREHPKTWQSIREGTIYVRKTPAILLVILVVGLVLLFGSNFNVVLPLLSTDVLHGGASGFGFLSAASGVGALCAALCLAWNNQKPTIRSLLCYTLAFGMLEVLFAASRLYLLSLVLIASIGFMENTFATQAITTLQAVTPDYLLGRVMSVQMLFFDGSLPLGYLLIGWLAGLYGAPRALLCGALLCLLVTTVGWLCRKPAERDLAGSVRL
jgi:MFS family permease